MLKRIAAGVISLMIGAAAMVVTTTAASAGPASPATTPAADTAGPEQAWPTSPDAQLRAWRESGVDIPVRKARPGDEMIEGAHIRPTKPGTRGRCGVGSTCLYSDADGGGFMFSISINMSVPNLREACLNGLCYDINDQLTSWENVSAGTYCWYKDQDYVNPGELMKYFGAVTQNVPAHLNDQASSVKYVGPSPEGSC